MPRTPIPCPRHRSSTLQYSWPITCGALMADDTALRETEEALTIAEASGDDMALAVALEALGVAFWCTMIRLQTANAE